MFTIFFCSQVYSVLVHTCQAGGTEEWHYLCADDQNSQIFLFCLFVRDWSLIVSATEGGWVGVSAWWGIREGVSQMPNLSMGLGVLWQGWATDPQICWHNMWIAPFAKTHLSPTRMPGKTSSEILRTLPALPISLTQAEAEGQGFTFSYLSIRLQLKLQFYSHPKAATSNTWGPSSHNHQLPHLISPIPGKYPKYDSEIFSMKSCSC